MNEQVEALAVRRLQWLNAIEAGNVDVIVYFLNEDAEISLPEDLNLKGKQAARRSLNGVFQKYCPKWLISNTSRLMAENCALEKGAFDLSLITRADKESVRYRGDYSILWSLDKNDKWRVEMEYFTAFSTEYSDRIYYFNESSVNMPSEIV
jgi:ketosteroid isomerase-like protein